MAVVLLLPACVSWSQGSFQDDFATFALDNLNGKWFTSSLTGFMSTPSTLEAVMIDGRTALHMRDGFTTSPSWRGIDSIDLNASGGGRFECRFMFTAGSKGTVFEPVIGESSWVAMGIIYDPASGSSSIFYGTSSESHTTAVGNYVMPGQWYRAVFTMGEGSAGATSFQLFDSGANEIWSGSTAWGIFSGYPYHVSLRMNTTNNVNEAYVDSVSFVSPCPSTGSLVGTVSLSGYTGDKSDIGLTIEAIQNGGIQSRQRLFLSSDGSYEVSDLPAGVYDLAFRTSQSLRKVISGVVVTGGAITTVNVDLANGDITGDNYVGPTDFSLLSSNAAESKYCNIILADTDRDIDGLIRFIEAARARGLYENIKFTVLVHSDKADLDIPGQRETFRRLHDEGNEIGVFYSYMRTKVANWLGIPASDITTIGVQLFADPNVEEQATATQAGFLASVNACVEGDSFKEEFWDVPHNWEGAPYLPYWTQWDADNPESTARVNRELNKSTAMLELQWATRTMWETYDRICLPQCFHFGEPVAKTKWPFSPLVKRGDISWWRAEIEQFEENLSTGRTPMLYVNTASELNTLTPGGWGSMLDPEEPLDCALDFISMMIDKGWQLITVRDFVRAYQVKWPCPEAPSSVFVMEDTLAGRKDQQGLTVPSHGRILRAETKHFQITDHEKRMAPEMVVAYDLQTPNLLRGGYTFGDPDVWSVGANKAQYASTTGNAVFWSMTEPLANANGVPYYHANKPTDTRNRTFTFYLGDNWEPYQFANASFKDVRKEGEKLFWSKEMISAVAGTDIRVRYDNVLDGSKQIVRVTVTGNGANGMPARFRVSPYFHQGWDNDYVQAGALRDPTIPDPLTVGQERNVFARVGSEEFEYSDSNAAAREQVIIPGTGTAQLLMFNRNPGLSPAASGWTIDDNPEMNRGFTLSFDGDGASVRLIDPPGPSHYVTAEIDLGTHVSGRSYEFTFEYWHGTPSVACSVSCSVPPSL